MIPDGVPPTTRPPMKPRSAQANALLDLESMICSAVARCEAFVKLYSQSEFLDSYLYVIGYCHFAGRSTRASDRDVPSRGGNETD